MVWRLDLVKMNSWAICNWVIDKRLYPCLYIEDKSISVTECERVFVLGELKGLKQTDFAAKQAKESRVSSIISMTVHDKPFSKVLV